MVKIIEKRKAQRLSHPLIKYRILYMNKVLRKAFIKNISGSGIRLVVDRSFRKGNKLKTILYFPRHAKPVTVLSKVIWCKKTSAYKDKANFDIGVRHIKIARRDMERFIFLFCEMLIEYFI